VNRSAENKTSRRSLFKPIKPKKLLHPSFQLISTSPRNRSTRLMMNQAYGRFIDRDGNFIEQFQTTGFNNRTFELYISELLHAEGFIVNGSAPQPDFEAQKDGARVFIECTTANPTDKADGIIRPYEPLNDLDLDAEKLRARAEDEIPIRFGGALRSKLNHRVGKSNPLAYWELPRVVGHPFILAVQTFHEHGSLMFTSAGLSFYLYGIRQNAEWNESGELIINHTAVTQHAYGNKTIPSAFFMQEGTENISAVLWTNAGTVPKFTRMALAGPYPDPSVTMLRSGTMFDSDPNAHAALPFVYIVGDPGAPDETWGQEAVLFHNPNAKHPVPLGLFSTVTEGCVQDGQYIDQIKGFSPYSSMSALIDGPGHRARARMLGDQVFSSLEGWYEKASARPA